MTIKLSEWAKKNGLTYATCYRWFRDGALPVKAYQNKTTGTIFVEEDSGIDSSSTMELFLKTMNKFMIENKSIIEFSAYVLNNFNLSSKTLPSQKLINSQDHIKNYVDSIMPEERKQEIKQKLENIKKSKDSSEYDISIDDFNKMLKCEFPFFRRVDESEEIKISEEELNSEISDKGEE